MERKTHTGSRRERLSSWKSFVSDSVGESSLPGVTVEEEATGCFLCLSELAGCHPSVAPESLLIKSLYCSIY